MVLMQLFWQFLAGRMSSLILVKIKMILRKFALSLASPLDFPERTCYTSHIPPEPVSTDPPPDTGVRIYSVIAAPRVGETKPMVSHMNPLLERGVSFKSEGRYDEAIAELRQLLQEDPNSCDGHYQLGLVFGFTGMFDESIEELLQAVRLAPARNDIRNDLALTYTMLGMYDEAKMEFEEVLRRDPNNKRALESMDFLSRPS